MDASRVDGDEEKIGRLAGKRMPDTALHSKGDLRTCYILTISRRRSAGRHVIFIRSTRL
jgi:hypothetical protein